MLDENQIVIKVNNVYKSFGKNKVLKNISFNVARGESVVFTGHNGAGKSTLIRIIAGLTTMDSGTIETVHGCRLSCIPERFPRIPFTAREYVEQMGIIDGLEKLESEKRCKELFEKFYMQGMGDVQIRNLSKGTLQKVSVIQALMTKPDILMLDEPLSGQDADSQLVFVNIINQLKKEGTTILMSCHEKYFINRISDRILNISEGNIEEKAFDNKKYTEYDVITFEILKNVTDEKAIQDVINKNRDMIVSVKKKGTTKDKDNLQVIIDEKYSNAFMAMLIDANARIKEMYHEAN